MQADIHAARAYDWITQNIDSVVVLFINVLQTEYEMHYLLIKNSEKEPLLELLRKAKETEMDVDTRTVIDSLILQCHSGTVDSIQSQNVAKFLRNLRPLGFGLVKLSHNISQEQLADMIKGRLLYEVMEIEGCDHHSQLIAEYMLQMGYQIPENLVKRFGSSCVQSFFENMLNSEHDTCHGVLRVMSDDFVSNGYFKSLESGISQPLTNKLKSPKHALVKNLINSWIVDGFLPVHHVNPIKLAVSQTLKRDILKKKDNLFQYDHWLVEQLVQLWGEYEQFYDSEYSIVAAFTEEVGQIDDHAPYKARLIELVNEVRIRASHYIK